MLTISDQSILDEHVDRVFNEDSKGHNVSTAFNQFESGSNRHLSASFSMGYRTLDRHHPPQSHFGEFFFCFYIFKKILIIICRIYVHRYLFTLLFLFKSGSQMTTSHGSYRGPSHHSMAGDSGYFHSGSRSAKSYSDTDFGNLSFTYF